MLHGKKIIVVMPGRNVAKTIRQTFLEIPRDIVDEVILANDASEDETAAVARELGINVFTHRQQSGYGGGQKTCYHQALELGADVIVMVHPDYQYTPKLITAMTAMITSGVYHAVLGSRMLGRTALSGGMPYYKFFSNRALTWFQNACLGQRLSEYHTGYRAFSREVLLRLPLGENSNDFVFDNEMLAQLAYFGYEIAELTCPTKYFPEASSMSFRKGITYGLGVLQTTLRYLKARAGVQPHPMFRPEGAKVYPGAAGLPELVEAVGALVPARHS